MKALRFVTASLAATALSLSVLFTVPATAAAPAEHRPPGHAKHDTMRWAAPKGFHIGSAVAGGGHHESQPYPDPFTSDGPYRATLAREFSSVSPEN